MTYPPGPGNPWQPEQPGPDQHAPYAPGPAGPPPGTPPHGGGHPQPPQGYQYPQQGQPYPGQLPPGGPGGFPGGPGQPPPAKNRRTGLLVGSLVGVVAVGAAAVGSYFAFGNGSAAASGEADPASAASRLLTAVEQEDAVGLLESLAPAEARLSADYFEIMTGELTRIGIFDESADPAALSFNGSLEGLAFDEAAEERVNEHLVINSVSSGTLTLESASPEDMPFSDKVLDVMPELPDTTAESETIDLASLPETGQPLRIATIQVDGEWYPSMFYTVADFALRESGMGWPRDSVPAVGADSPEAAVEQLVTAALDVDVRRLVELLPPDEMAVVHDLGPLLLEAVGQTEPTGARLVELNTSTTDVTGGTRVSLDHVSLEVNGEQVSIQRDGDCLQATGPQGSERLCPVEQARMSLSQDPAFPQEALPFIERLAENVLGAGIVTVEVDGEWYVSPFRTGIDLMAVVLSSVEPEDIDALLAEAPR
ncbi:hypothetical protein [Actinoalloteichus caeruleus]|uniref:hypothetical protein n=1 Tax=Actinoalloteichus cyanogriseus TaxID=2893586 RepID=UPI0004BFE74F|nr:hypothetical protein [Actinoalloteichus caeruleus]